MLAKNMVALRCNSQSIVELFLDWLCHTPHQKFLKCFVVCPLFCLLGSHFQLRCTKFGYAFVLSQVLSIEASSNRACTNVRIFSHCLHPHELLHVYVSNMHSLWCVDQIARIKYCESMSYVARPTYNICMLKNISLHFHLLEEYTQSPINLGRAHLLDIL